MRPVPFVGIIRAAPPMTSGSTGKRSMQAIRHGCNDYVVHSFHLRRPDWLALGSPSFDFMAWETLLTSTA
jgi:hypothetical protein